MSSPGGGTDVVCIQCKDVANRKGKLFITVPIVVIIYKRVGRPLL